MRRPPSYASTRSRCPAPRAVPKGLVYLPRRLGCFSSFELRHEVCRPCNDHGRTFPTPDQASNLIPIGEERFGIDQGRPAECLVQLHSRHPRYIAIHIRDCRTGRAGDGRRRRRCWGHRSLRDGLWLYLCRQSGLLRPDGLSTNWPRIRTTRTTVEEFVWTAGGPVAPTEAKSRLVGTLGGRHPSTICTIGGTAPATVEVEEARRVHPLSSNASTIGTYLHMSGSDMAGWKCPRGYPPPLHPVNRGSGDGEGRRCYPLLTPRSRPTCV